MYTLKSCCGCLSLSMGCKIVAVLNIISPIFYLMMGEHWLSSNFIVTSVISIAFGGLLFHATNKEDRSLLRVWLIINNIFVGILVVCGVLLLIFAAFDVEMPSDSTGDPLGMGISGLIGAVIDLFFSLVVYSYIEELRSRDGQNIQNLAI